MNKIIKWAENLPKDKILHFTAGMIISLTVHAALFFVADDRWIWEMLAVCTAAVGKEVIDEKIGRQFDWYDTYATVLGGLVATILSQF